LTSDVACSVPCAPCCRLCASPPGSLLPAWGAAVWRRRGERAGGPLGLRKKGGEHSARTNARWRVSEGPRAVHGPGRGKCHALAHSPLVSAHAIESLWLARAWPDVGGHRRRKCAELIELYLEPSLVDYEGARHKYKSHRRVFDSMTQELKAIVAEQALTGPERCARSYFGVLGLLCRIVALGC
jgi:hypothetical protein